MWPTAKQDTVWTDVQVFGNESVFGILFGQFWDNVQCYVLKRNGSTLFDVEATGEGCHGSATGEGGGGHRFGRRVVARVSLPRRFAAVLLPAFPVLKLFSHKRAFSSGTDGISVQIVSKAMLKWWC